MELLNALLHSGLITEEQRNEIRIIVINNNQYRASNASTSRYHIRLGNRVICSVKRLPLNGVFDVQSAVELQRRIVLSEKIGAPEIYATYQGERHLYIMEQYIEGVTLHELLRTKACSGERAGQIIDRIMEELAHQTAEERGDVPPNELDLLMQRAARLSLSEESRQLLQRDIDRMREKLKQPATWTTSDILAQNIIVAGESIFLIDFDFSSLTRLAWMDRVRFRYYSGYIEPGLELESVTDASKLPEGVDYSFLRLLFHLYEMNIQERNHDIGHNELVQQHLQQDFMALFNAYYGSMEGAEEVTPLAPAGGMIEAGKPEAYVQLFWTDDDIHSFAEEASIVLPIKQNESAAYTFALDRQVNELRLDPCNIPAYMKLSAIIVVDANGTPYDVWGNCELELANMEQLFARDGSAFFVSLGGDPQWKIKSLPISYIQELRVELACTQHIVEIKGHVDRLIESEIDLIDRTESLKKANDRQQLNIEQLQRTVQQLKDGCERAESARQAAEERLAAANLVIEQYRNSTSWKATEPLRAMGTRMRKLRGLCKKAIRRVLGSRRAVLQPVHQIETAPDGNWLSKGDDPQFIVRSSNASGWIELRYVGAASHHIPLTLYYDTGSGFSEQQTIQAGYLNGTVREYANIVYIPPGVESLRLDPGAWEQVFALVDMEIRRVGRAERVWKALLIYLRRNGLSVLSIMRLARKVLRYRNDGGLRGLLRKGNSMLHQQVATEREQAHSYHQMVEMKALGPRELEMQREAVKRLAYRPLISVIVPVYNVEEKWLRLCVQSVQNQTYDNWELCLVDDCSTKPHVSGVLRELAATDNRIKIRIREANGHISAASNDALALARGEFVALLDHDDELTVDALFENVRVLNEHPDADIIYSDEDKVDLDGGYHSPFFKPDWSPDTLMSQMYTCHLSVYRKSVVDRAGGFRLGYEGSQDFDLMLRVSELTERIYHIPKVLYHWRAIPESTAYSGSTKSYSHVAGTKALNDALARRGVEGWVEDVEDIPNLYRVRYRNSLCPKVSIIIPSKNMTEVLSKCLDSIFRRTNYPDYEVIVVDNGSTDPTTHAMYEEWKAKEPARFFVHALDIPFNYSKLNNFGVSKAKGQLLLLLNNDVEVISPDWMDDMVGQASRPEIGAVGASLLYPDHTFQHAGVVLGLGGIAGHSHKHFPSHSPGYFHRLKMVANYTAVTAACLMVRKDVYEQVGGFEEQLQVAFNDVDFCLKVWSKGYRNVWLPQVLLYHYESKSRGHEDTPEKQRRFQGEIAWMRERWAYVLDKDPNYNSNLTRDREDYSIG